MQTTSPGELKSIAANAIMVITPYRFSGTWVFDDPAVGLRREPFVAGVPEIIDRMVASIPNAKSGFRLLFSGSPFPGHQHVFTNSEEEYGGGWYTATDGSRGWLCPALFKYFSKAPEKIYARVEPLGR